MGKQEQEQKTGQGRSTEADKGRQRSTEADISRTSY